MLISIGYREVVATCSTEVQVGFVFLRMAGILQTGTISHYNTAESHSHYAL